MKFFVLKSTQYLGLLLFASFFFASCEKETITPPTMEPQVAYSFFVAGHTYGHYRNLEPGMHPPFVQYFSKLNAHPSMAFGVLTGDVVPQSIKINWDTAQTQLKALQMPIHIAAGNHDRGPEFKARYPNYYYHFQEGKELFIILSPTDWNIEGQQEQFLKNTINNLKDEVTSIFIFTHELLWWSPDNLFKNININYKGLWPGENNFYTNLLPFLESISNDVVLFAGDMGAKAAADSFMYYKKDKLTYIGSGMGNFEEDNLIIVDVFDNGKYQFHLTAINGDDPERLGRLEDYVLP